MTIDRKLWLDTFTKQDFPNWHCPRCEIGILRPVMDSFRYWESADSHDFGRKHLLENHRIPDDNSLLGMELSEYRYSVLLSCNKCREFVASCGSGHVDENYFPELKDTSFVDVFYPEYFYPAVNIFTISKKYPQIVSNEIRSSFKLFFADPSASANYIRKAIDAILTDKGIRRYSSSKGKRKTINLHDRILEFEKVKPEVAKNLLAIKWLGNEGSHNNTLTKNDILDVYEILEIVLDDLYVGYRKSVDMKVKKINKTKKALHPST